jgi:hypothetical protein
MLTMMKMKFLVLSALAMVFGWSGAVEAAEFNYKNLDTAIMKLSPDYDYDTYVDSYMESFRQPVWQNVRNDEFKLNAKRAETIDMMKKSAAAYNLDDTMTIHTTVNFGEYDFKTKKFALAPFETSSFFYENNCCNKLPRQIKVFFTNPEILDGLPMETDAAQAFVDRHKQYGNINRNLQADITIKLKSLISDNELGSDIVKIVLRDPSKGNPVVLTVPAGS